MLLAFAAFAACPIDPALSLRAELYLGRNRHGRPYVSESRWRAWLAEAVTPTFPAFTVIDQVGYWQGDRERSRTLVLFHAPAQGDAVLAIAESYRTRFEQDAVLVDDAPVDARMCVP